MTNLLRAAVRVETARLILSPPGPGDVEAIFGRYAGDPEVTRYLGWPTHRTLDDTRGFLAFSDAQWAQSAGPYLIRERGAGTLIGSTGLMLDDMAGAMTGYVLAKDAWGRGYATEALTAMVDVARGLRIRRLYALCHPDHAASQRVLIKCGFERDFTWTGRMEFPNLAPGVLQDTLCYWRAP